jgi:uncharacterized protein (TIGR02145 family)
MRRLICLTFLLPLVCLNAQEITFTFSAELVCNQTSLDSIRVENQTQGGEMVVYWPDLSVTFYLTSIETIKGNPSTFYLSQNFPNPFSQSTSFKLYVPEEDLFFIHVLDVFGRSLTKHERYLKQGTHQFTFESGNDLQYLLRAGSGKYIDQKIFIQLQGNNRVSPQIFYNGQVADFLQLPKSKILTMPYELGDELKFTGYVADEFGDVHFDVIVDAPVANTDYTFEINNVIPEDPSSIVGLDIVCEAESGLIYEVDFIAGLVYQWALPGGWEIDAGQGTHMIQVTAGPLSGNITVFAENNCGQSNPRAIAVTVLPLSAPTITTANVTSITPTTATSGGNVMNDGCSTVTSRGVCWSISPAPTINDEFTTDGSGTGSFVSNITGLSPATTYYLRAYATNTLGTSYGSQMQFTTSTGSAPVVVTAPITNISSNAATGGGEVTAQGDTPVSARGICWSTVPNPTLNDNHTVDGSGTGSFISQMTNLTPATTYYVRAYATNTAGTAYGAELVFTTTAGAPPTVTTTSVSNITLNSAQGGGNVTAGGDTPVNSRGVCWSTSPGPTLDDSFTTDGSGTGSFISSLTGLNPSTTYYVRAYATNTAGTAYGNEQQFTTLSPQLATVTTANITNITHNSATGGGNVTNDGGATVTARGICWGTNPNPTLADNFTVNGSGTGSFTSNITGLTPNTTYYVRAYATNSVGTNYGNQVSFTTLPPPFVCGNNLTDVDGNVYGTVQIGTQCWMKENLKTTKYRNGSNIEYPGSNNSAWINNTTGAYAYYNNDISWKPLYGALYNWHAVNNPHGLCPTGWKVPSDGDWHSLRDHVEYNNINNPGNQLKSCRQVNSPLGGDCDVAWDDHPRWNPDAWGTHYGTDVYGFAAFPGSSRNTNGTYNALPGGDGYWWSSELYAANLYAWYFQLNYLSGEMIIYRIGGLRMGKSVRCLLEQ